MFELANEPVNIKGTDGAYGSTSDACFANAKIYFQSIVDKIRSHCRNIIWVPGLAYQSQYAGYATHRIEGDNIGFAVHCYPGWYGSDAEKRQWRGNRLFHRWRLRALPARMGYASRSGGGDCPHHGDGNRLGTFEIRCRHWGKSITGEGPVARAFGANFKYIADNAGNVSWLFFHYKKPRAGSV